MSVEGYWISPEGEFEEVSDHFETIREAPERFGFTEDDAVAWTRKVREQVLREVIDKGWIRVRGHRHYTTFELDRLSESRAFNIKQFLQATGAWENERVEVHELGTGRKWSEDACFFLEEAFLARLAGDKRKKPKR